MAPSPGGSISAQGPAGMIAFLLRSVARAEGLNFPVIPRPDPVPRRGVVAGDTTGVKFVRGCSATEIYEPRSLSS